MPLPVLEQAQRDLIALPGVGMSVMEISHRSKTFEDLLNTAIADIRGARKCSGQLQDSDAAGRRHAAVFHGAHEPSDCRRDRGLHRYRIVGGQGDQGSAKVGAVNIAASTKADDYVRIPTARTS